MRQLDSGILPAFVTKYLILKALNTSFEEWHDRCVSQDRGAQECSGEETHGHRMFLLPRTGRYHRSRATVSEGVRGNPFPFELCDGARRSLHRHIALRPLHLDLSGLPGIERSPRHSMHAVRAAAQDLPPILHPRRRLAIAIRHSLGARRGPPQHHGRGVLPVHGVPTVQARMPDGH